jgi:hypothetical protein
MKNALILLVLTCIAAPTISHAEKPTEYFALPGALYFSGVGTLYGTIASIKNIGDSDYSTYVGIAAGDASALGLGFGDIPLWQGQFSYFYAQASDATIETQYQRGGDNGNTYEQSLTGEIHRFALTHDLPFESTKSTIAISRSSVSIDEYADDNGRKISINQSGLDDINTTSIMSDLTWDNRTGPVGLAQGTKVSTSLRLDLGRTAQSDQGVFEYKLSHHINVTDNALASVYFNGSHAFIISKDKSHDTEIEVKDALDANCNLLLTPSQQTSCLALEQDLTNYIVASNNNGTSKAVGGSQGLRSFQESFFRGSNSFVEGFELQWQLPESLQFSNTTKLQWVIFTEGAQIADEFNKLSDNSYYSVGTGIRAYTGDIPVRAEFAYGENGNAFLLTAGLVF